MRVGFDAHMVGRQETGNETYALGLLNGLDQIGFPVDAYTFDRPTHLRGYPGGIHRVHRVWPRSSYIRIPFTTPLVAARDRLDLYHATAYVLPPFLPCRAVVTIHDLSFELHPEWFPIRVRHMLATLVPLAVRKAARVIAVSECTKCDIVERYKVNRAKVAVTYLAPRPVFATPMPRQERAEPFFLYVGNVEPRKNVETVIQAMRILRDRGMKLPLIAAGKSGLRFRQVAGLVRHLGLEDVVRFTGYVPDTELQALYASCLALVHPALYEGFGLTPLEAMAQGAPVIVANCASLPEVVGDAALLVEPENAEAWAEVMGRLAGDRALQIDLSTRGMARADQFSWRRCARQTVAVYESIRCQRSPLD